MGFSGWVLNPWHLTGSELILTTDMLILAPTSTVWKSQCISIDGNGTIDNGDVTVAVMM